MKYNRALGGLIVFVVIIGVFAFLFLGKPGNTLLYFNANSDLPDPLLYERQSANATGLPVHVIELNKSYDVVFTIASLENRPITYTYEVSSELFNATETITLSPEEFKRVRVKLTPQESQKWTLDSDTSSRTENIIDITKDSWIAERKDFQVLVREDSLPTIVEEEYHLPISSDVAHFGRIYHINLSSLDELREKPFIKEYESKNIEGFEKTTSIDLINLSIVDDTLIVVVESQRTQYISKETPFVVKLFRERELEDIKVDEASGVEVVQRISFWYKIK